MEPIRRWYKDDMEKRQANSELLQGLQNMTDAIINGNKERPNKLVKPTKVFLQKTVDQIILLQQCRLSFFLLY